MEYKIDIGSSQIKAEPWQGRHRGSTANRHERSLCYLGGPGPKQQALAAWCLAKIHFFTLKYRTHCDSEYTFNFPLTRADSVGQPVGRLGWGVQLVDLVGQPVDRPV